MRKEIERKFTMLIDDKYNTLKMEISKESRNRYESIEALKAYLEVKNINPRMMYLNYKDWLSLNRMREKRVISLF